MSDDIKVEDNFKAISSILRVVSNLDTIIYYVDVNNVIKRQPPASTCSSSENPDDPACHQLVWINPGKREYGNTKLCVIEFPHRCDDYTMFFDMSRYTLFVTFFRTELLKQQVVGQGYLYVEPGRNNPGRKANVNG